MQNKVGVINDLCSVCGRRWEIVSGRVVKLVEPPVRYRAILGNISFAIFQYFGKGVTRHYIDMPVCFSLGDSEVYMPYLTIIGDNSQIEGKCVYGSPDLVLEIWSAGTLETTIEERRGIYVNANVCEVWDVFADEKRVRVSTIQNSEVEQIHVYSFSESILSGYFPGLAVAFNKFLQ